MLNRIEEAIQKVVISEIETVSLAKLLRSVEPSLGLTNALKVAKAIKTAYRLGGIRGRVLKG